MERFVTIDLLSESEAARVIDACVAAGLTGDAIHIRACLPFPVCDLFIPSEQGYVMPSTDLHYYGAGRMWHHECWSGS